MELSSLIVALNIMSANQVIVDGVVGRPTPAILFADAYKMKDWTYFGIYGIRNWD